ncbi:probable serine/threonine-protein kinase dyrk2 isoform X2 [Eurosta solidaginis]|uniref:probable serine/threonine-protein kinase dyrk2 isoform X2 n=1 Tax=Eurosta solidaginis TaxID=178769 RepID=UPI0035309C4C
MEVCDDRPASVYDNLKTPTTSNIRVHTSTPKATKGGKTTTSAFPVKAKAGTGATFTESVARSEAPSNRQIVDANGITGSPIYADIAYKFDDKSQLPQQKQLTFPHLKEQLKPIKAAHHTTTKLQFPTKAMASLHTNANGNINNYTNSNNSNQRSIKEHANVSITMPTTAQASPPLRATTTTMAETPTYTSTSAQPASRTTQRPLSQHSQSELYEYEASQSIAAVKAALNDAKSKFFGLNGYATQEQQQHNNTSNHNNNKESNTSNPIESRLKQHTSTSPRLLIDNQFTKVQIITTAPTPPPKIHQPKYQNIPENSAIFRNNQATQKQPPELPPKPVDAIATPSRMTAPTSSTQTDGAVSTTPNSTVFSSNSAHSTTPSPSPTSPLDAVKLSLSPSQAAYQQVPLNDIDISQPSQAVYMSTTVPQNIKASKHPNPMQLKHPNLVRWLLILEIIVGLLISFLAIWIFCLAPNTAIQYNPYWSGLVLLLTGILGLVLVRYQRIKRRKVRENCFKFLRADLYLLALLAVLLCCIAFFCAALHYARLTANTTHCASTNPLVEQGSCTCTFNVPENEMTTGMNSSSTTGVMAKGLLEEEVMPDDMDDQSYKVEYWDLSCKEVRAEWTKILIYSAVLNLVGSLLAISFALLLVGCRNKGKRIYTSVQTSNF